MALALFHPKPRASRPNKADEPKIDQVVFNIFKFNNRPKPKDKKRVLIISCFTEFGCEMVGRMYCIPKLIKKFPGYYIIVMGWYGRDYLYRHLVDEFWEVKEEFMWLRDYCYAFHHSSHNLTRLEQSAAHHGTVFPSQTLGKYVIGNYCRTCGKFWNEWRVKVDRCPGCSSTFIINSLMGGVDAYRKTAIRFSPPKKELLEWARSIIKPNSVGIFARARKTYGRNLPADFYVKLIERLESMGHNIVWLGERHNTLPCPVEHVVDFSSMPEARELERTFAVICNLDFTIQFWTASSRLAGVMGVPFILFESPEQIYCSGFLPGQEGKRLELTTFGPKKVVLAHYLNVLENPERALDDVIEARAQLEAGDYGDMIGQVEDFESTKTLMVDYYESMSGESDG